MEQTLHHQQSLLIAHTANPSKRTLCFLGAFLIMNKLKKKISKMIDGKCPKTQYQPAKLKLLGKGGDVALKQPIPVRACEVLPNLHNQANDQKHPIYENFMFGTPNKNKLKPKKVKHKRKRRESFNQSVEYSQRSAREQVNILPEVGSGNSEVNPIKANHSRSQQRKGHQTRPEYSDQTITLCEIYSEGKKSLFTIDNSSSNDGSRKTNKKEGIANNNKSSLYQDKTIENLRNIYKAEKELRGIFQAVKVYEFPILKDAQGNIQIIGKYEPKKLKRSNLCPFRPPSRLSVNPIVFDKAFGDGAQTGGGEGSETMFRVQKLDDTIKMPLEAASLELLNDQQKASINEIQQYKVNNDETCKQLQSDDNDIQKSNTQIHQNWDISTEASFSGLSGTQSTLIGIESANANIESLKIVEYSVKDCKQNRKEERTDLVTDILKRED